MKHLVGLLRYVYKLFPEVVKEGMEMTEEPAIPSGRTMVEPIEGFGYNNSIGTYWCFMTKDFRQASKFTSCRDYLNESMLAFLSDDTSTYYTSSCLPIDLDKLRLLFSGAITKENIMSGLRAINIYSRLAGWELS